MLARFGWSIFRHHGGPIVLATTAAFAFVIVTATTAQAAPAADDSLGFSWDLPECSWASSHADLSVSADGKTIAVGGRFTYDLRSESNRLELASDLGGCGVNVAPMIANKAISKSWANRGKTASPVVLQAVRKIEKAKDNDLSWYNKTVAACSSRDVAFSKRFESCGALHTALDQEHRPWLMTFRSRVDTVTESMGNDLTAQFDAIGAGCLAGVDPSSVFEAAMANGRLKRCQTDREIAQVFQRFSERFPSQGAKEKADRVVGAVNARVSSYEKRSTYLGEKANCIDQAELKECIGLLDERDDAETETDRKHIAEHISELILKQPELKTQFEKLFSASKTLGPDFFARVGQKMFAPYRPLLTSVNSVQDAQRGAALFEAYSGIFSGFLDAEKPLPDFIEEATKLYYKIQHVMYNSGKFGYSTAQSAGNQDGATTMFNLLSDSISLSEQVQEVSGVPSPYLEVEKKWVLAKQAGLRKRSLSALQNGTFSSEQLIYMCIDYFTLYAANQSEGQSALQNMQMVMMMINAVPELTMAVAFSGVKKAYSVEKLSSMSQLDSELRKTYGISTDDIGDTCLALIQQVSNRSQQKQQYREQNCQVYCECPYTGQATWFRGTSCPSGRCTNSSNARWSESSWDEVSEQCP